MFYEEDENEAYNVNFQFDLSEQSINPATPKSSGIWLTVIIAIILIAIIVYFIYSYFFKQNNNSDEKEEPFVALNPETIEMQEHRPN